jgi:hypothetical protein
VSSSPERHSFDRDVERIVSYATDKIDSAANGVAIFAYWNAGKLGALIAGGFYMDTQKAKRPALAIWRRKVISSECG